MDVFVIQETDDSVDLDSLSASVRDGDVESEVALISSEAGHWRSVLDWASFTCRGHHKLERKLIMSQDDFSIVTKLLLQNTSKTLTGDPDHLLSDLLELQNKLRKVRRRDQEPYSDGGVIDEACKSYKKFIKSSGLVDNWDLVRTCLQCLEENQRKVKILISEISINDLDLVEMISSEVTHVTVINGKVEFLGKVSPAEIKCDNKKSVQKLSDQVILVSSFLRLLLCSKEELSLARAVTGSGLLTDEQFTRVRREAEQTSLPMYQTIVSFVRQMDLGGRSYAPGDANTLHELLPYLSQFNNIMEKLQTRLEETSGAVTAVMAVITTLKAWLAKQGVMLAPDLLDTVTEMVEEAADRQTSLQSTPARGRMGRPAMKVLAGLVDLLACVPVDRGGEDIGSTPARNKKLVASFRTPQAEQVLDPEDEMDALAARPSLGERLGNENVPVVNKTPVTRLAYPRYKSSNDFTEGSPALLRSVDKDAVIITGGRTLMMRAGGGAWDGGSPETSVDNTRRILAEVKERQDEENKEKVEEIKQNIKKTKRCLNKEVDLIVRDKMGMKRKNVESDDGKEKRGASKKKKLATPKGQKKLTSFFTK